MNLIGIGIASATEDIKIDTMLAIIESLSLFDYPTTFIVVRGCSVHTNRNLIAQEALKLGCSHVLFIDTDMIFENDGMKKLLALNKDIVGAMYNKRRFPLTNIVTDYTDQIEPFKTIDFVPTGFMLIKTEVFKKLEMPYFFYDERSTSDDSYFCHKAQAAGLEVWVDPTIKMKHIGSFLY